jgi:hypothetical protein
LVIAFASFAPAETLPPSERQKIEALIEAVGSLKEARFVRNGSAYSADSAAYFLRRKWQANESNVKTALDFIKNVASFSGTSGKPYLIRFNDGKELTSRDFLLGVLARLDQSRG